MRAENTKPIWILICAIVGVVILFASLLFSKADLIEIKEGETVDFGLEWQVEVAGKQYSNVKLPTDIKGAQLGDTIILKKTLPANIEDNTFVFFRASHQSVKVFIDSQLVQSYGFDEERLFSKSPASTWVVVPLSEELSGTPIRVELIGAYDRYAGMVNSFYICDMSAIFHNIIVHHISSIFISLTLIVLGLAMLLVIAVLHNGEITTSLYRLGILAIIIGGWSICVTNTLQVIYPNTFVLLNLEFLLFNLLPPVSLWFFLSFPHYAAQKTVHVLFWISIAHFLLIEVLQIIALADYMESIIITHIIIFSAMIYIVATGIRDLIRKHASREVKVLVFSVVLLTCFACIDVLRFYQPDIEDEGFFTRIGTLLFIAIWTAEVIWNMSKRYINIARTEALEVLAYVDLMTGLKNRTAFEEWLNDYQCNPKGVDIYILTFDMNCLKDINDSFGHLKGDQAIIAIAHIIKNAFESQGICYRTGGDEICVILSKTELMTAKNVEDAICKIEDAVKSTSKALKLDFSVAVGYSHTLRSENKDFYEAYREADRYMYINKHRMKNDNSAEQA